MHRLTDDPFARRLFAEAQEGVAVFDQRGALVAWNTAAKAITGWDEVAAAQQDLLGKGAGMLEIRDGKWVDLRRSAVATPAGELRILLFNDANAEVALNDARRDLTDAGLIDQVTRLAGKPLALGHLERSVALAKRDKRAVGALAVSVDIPKVGEDIPMDELMRQLSKRVIAATRGSDLAARTDESELLLVLTAMSSEHDASMVAVRLLLKLSQSYVLGGKERSATISVGVASYPTDGDSAQATFNAARGAMTRVRSSGGGYQVAHSRIKEQA